MLLDRSPSRVGLPFELREWIRSAHEEHIGARSQHPADELIAEHFIIQGVMGAVESEAPKLHRGGFRLELWEFVVDFIGNFAHQIHRAKEDKCFIPRLETLGVVENAYVTAMLQREHRTAERLTHDLCDALGEGDLEKAQRAVLLYASIMREHMQREEMELFRPAQQLLPAEAVGELRQAFDEIEHHRFGHRDRSHYLAVAGRIGRMCSTPMPWLA